MKKKRFPHALPVLLAAASSWSAGAARAQVPMGAPISPDQLLAQTAAPAAPAAPLPAADSTPAPLDPNQPAPIQPPGSVIDGSARPGQPVPPATDLANPAPPPRPRTPPAPGRVSSRVTISARCSGSSPGRPGSTSWCQTPSRARSTCAWRT